MLPVGEVGYHSVSIIIKLVLACCLLLVQEVNAIKYYLYLQVSFVTSSNSIPRTSLQYWIDNNKEDWDYYKIEDCPLQLLLDPHFIEGYCKKGN